MSTMDGWLSTSSAWVGARHTPVSVGNLIARQPIAITITREVPPTSVTTLAAQTVRIDILGNVSEDIAYSELASVQTQLFVLLGYKDHPTVADTDIQVGDTFPYDGRLWAVRKVEAGLADRVLAIIEDTGMAGG